MPDLKMTTTELNGQKAVLNIQEINAAKRAARALIYIQEVKYTTTEQSKKCRPRASPQQLGQRKAAGSEKEQGVKYMSTRHGQ